MKITLTLTLIAAAAAAAASASTVHEESSLRGSSNKEKFALVTGALENLAEKTKQEKVADMDEFDETADCKEKGPCNGDGECCSGLCQCLGYFGCACRSSYILHHFLS